MVYETFDFVTLFASGVHHYICNIKNQFDSFRINFNILYRLHKTGLASKKTHAVYIILIHTDFFHLIPLFEIFQKGATFVIEKGRYHFDPVMESPFQTVCEFLGP